MMDDSVWEHLGYAIVEQAACDVIALRDAGIVVNGRCIAAWPKRDGKDITVVGDYDCKSKVEALLYWFNCGPMEELLNLLDSNVDADRIIEELGLCGYARTATRSGPTK